MRPLADNNVDDARLMGSHNAQLDLCADAVGSEAPEYRPDPRQGLAIPTDDAIAHKKTCRCARPVLVEFDNDGARRAIIVTQWMQLSAEIAAPDRARLRQPFSDPRDGLRGNGNRGPPRTKGGKSDKSPARIDNRAAMGAAG